MAKLKMVKGKTYMCPPLFGAERTLVPGDIVDVPDEKAELLLSESYWDASNNQHFYFAEVAGEEEAAAPRGRQRKAKLQE